MLRDGPAANTPLSVRPSRSPAATSKRSSRSVTWLSTSTIPGRFTGPETAKILVALQVWPARPLLFQANTGGIPARVLTLLITHGLTPHLESAASGSFGRVEARRQPGDARSASTSPPAKPR